MCNDWKSLRLIDNCFTGCASQAMLLLHTKNVTFFFISFQCYCQSTFLPLPCSFLWKWNYDAFFSRFSPLRFADYSRFSSSLFQKYYFARAEEKFSFLLHESLIQLCQFFCASFWWIAIVQQNEKFVRCDKRKLFQSPINLMKLQRAIKACLPAFHAIDCRKIENSFLKKLGWHQVNEMRSKRVSEWVSESNNNFSWTAFHFHCKSRFVCCTKIWFVKLDFLLTRARSSTNFPNMFRRSAPLQSLKKAKTSTRVQRSIFDWWCAFAFL